MRKRIVAAALLLLSISNCFFSNNKRNPGRDRVGCVARTHSGCDGHSDEYSDRYRIHSGHERNRGVQLSFAAIRNTTRYRGAAWFSDANL